MERHSFSSNEPIRVYNVLSGVVYNPQRITNDDPQTAFKFVRRSVSGLTGEIVTNGPGVKVVHFLDRFHGIREDRDTIVMAVVDVYDEEVPVRIERNGGDYVIERVNGGKETVLYRMPVRYYIEEEDKHINVLSNIGVYATMTVLMNVMDPAQFRPVPENIDEFSFRAERSFTSVETGRHYLVARRPGFVGIRENYIVGLEIADKAREKRVRESWFVFEGVHYQFHHTILDDGRDGYAISCLRGGIMSDTMVVDHVSFEEGDYDFRDILRKMARELYSMMEEKEDDDTK